MEKFNIERKDFNVYMTPKDGKYTYLIIFLHGLGDVSESYVGFFTETEVLPKNIPIKIILLQSPYKKVLFDRPLGTSWFTINEFPLVSKDVTIFQKQKFLKQT